MPLRPEFREALSLLAQAFKVLSDEGLGLPVLVGGAAVELYTTGGITSGDFDLVTPHQRVLENTLVRFGFERPHRPGELLGGVIHRRLDFGVQVVSGLLMAGKADRARIKVFDIEGGRMAVIPVEDLIADRMGQAFADQPPREDMLDQALMLYRLAEAPDLTYLDKRICEETVGGANLASLIGDLP